MLLKSALIIIVYAATTIASFGSRTNPHTIATKRAAAIERFSESIRRDEGGFIKRAASPGVKNITFSNPKASQFYVDGASLPQVEFDIGPSWAGLLPISGNANETRKLFFWFFPPGPQGSLDDLIFWTNGGPGCSSLEGMFQENGPVTWMWGTAKPIQNEYSWTNLSSVLYVEQPVGTGYSEGTPNAQNETDVASQLVGFFQQFLEVFSELKGKNFYLSGESYAGMYVPYIADYIYKHSAQLDLKLKGIWIADPVLGWDVVQNQIPAVNFVHKYENVFALNQTFMKELDKTAKRCGYSDYMAKHLKYPPHGLLPLPGNSITFDEGCDVWDMIFNAALLVNPAFNVYRIFDVYPILWDVLGFPGSFPNEQTTPLYFDREDVKSVLHVSSNKTWEECSSIDVFPNGDSSLPPAFTVLPSVIEKSQRSVIIHGLADYILIAEGARIVLQNMTWAGKQGFQKELKKDSFIIDGIGAYGNMQSERGLTYYEVSLTGHMVPQFAPWAGVQSMQYLMGFRSTP
ncbi:alpha/beta-hydrolase [Serendipita vermifera]|nr:alpha/beta-hydrolase [Serendipita vermifera]